MKIVLIACLLAVATASPIYDEFFSTLRTVASFLKGYLSTDYGYNQVKVYILNLKSNADEAVNIRKTFQKYTDGEWKEAVNALFKKVPHIAIEPGFGYPDVPELFGKVKSALATDEGIVVIRDYLENLNSSNEIIQGISTGLLLKNDAELKRLFSVLFSDLPEVPLDPI